MAGKRSSDVQSVTQQYRFRNEIGKGATSTVFLVVKQCQLYASKRLPRQENTDMEIKQVKIERLKVCILAFDCSWWPCFTWSVCMH